ncbi:MULTISPECIES: LAGLIDADG family homing endonuclease [Rhodococcus]|uniref:LAGLIDADG family homing endonuclease n=1 Tax=Rhodococcus sp. TaxID=1831 RepID=UPI00178C3484
MGLLNATTGPSTKRIPRKYLEADEQERRDLLAGLMDTDGTVAGSRAVEFDNTNECLANDVLELACSLRYRAVLRTKPAILNGTEHGTCFTVSFATHDKVFGLHRKQLIHDQRAQSSNSSRLPLHRRRP